jgi:molybdopterin molybdotransferase
MVERRQPIWVKDAIEKVMQWKKRGGVEWVSIDDCEGLFLGEPLKADHDVPPFNRSPYDGFAIRSEDTQTASREQPVKLNVIDEIGAGEVSHKFLEQNQAIRIMTGAALPAGADSVIMLELVTEEKAGDQDFIWIKRKVHKDENVSFQGEDAQEGQVLLEKGTYINPGVKALLATFGYSMVSVSKKPVIGIIATGSELLGIKEPLVPGKIRNSNGYMIEAQVKRSGGVVKKYENCADDVGSLYTAIQKAMEECDAVITTGGVSVGDFDYLPEIYKRLKADVLFNKIAMRPGSVTTVAVANEKLLFGLSGNPSACYVGFELYVRPIIRYWLHSPRPFLRVGQAFLQSDFPKANPFNRFVRSKISFEEGKLQVNPVGLDKSSVVTSLSLSDCLMVLPGGTRGYKKGDLVDVILLDDQTGSEEPWKEKPRSAR